MKPVRYITLPLEEYEAMVNEIELLRQKRDGIFPEIEDIVFLSPRLYGHLQRQGIKKINDLEETKASDWTRIPGFGRKSWEELKGLMMLFALNFKPE